MSKVFTKATNSSTLPQETLRAHIVMLPKPGKDPNTLANFRPISLLNSDTKVYAKLLVRRRKNIIPTIIQHDQMGFVKGRQTSDATRRIINVIHHAERTRTPSLLLSIDTEKAFDRVHWTYKEMVLTKLGFKGSILKQLMPSILAHLHRCTPQVFYPHPSTSVMEPDKAVPYL